MNRKTNIIKFGSDCKIQIFIDDLPDGLSMQEVDFSCTFRVGQSTTSLSKSQLKNPEYGVYIAPLATDILSRGDLWLDIQIKVPDSDFSDGYRNEVQSIMCNVKII